jgi:hypothetical protein
MSARCPKTLIVGCSYLSLLIPLAANASHFGESSAHGASSVTTHEATSAQSDASDSQIVIESVDSGVAYAPSPSGSSSERRSLSLLMGFEGAVSHTDDSFFGTFNIGVEGARFGVNTQFTGIRLPWDAETSDDTHPIGLINAYATYTVFSRPTARLRIEAGLMAAFARDLSTVAPGFGVSGYSRVAGLLGVEGAAHAAFYPYDQLDWNAGLTLALGSAQLRGGWRRIWLNDRGLVDGIAHEEVFSGPYLGLSCVF